MFSYGVRWIIRASSLVRNLERRGSVSIWWHIIGVMADRLLCCEAANLQGEFYGSASRGFSVSQVDRPAGLCLCIKSNTAVTRLFYFAGWQYNDKPQWRHPVAYEALARSVPDPESHPLRHTTQ